MLRFARPDVPTMWFTVEERRMRGSAAMRLAGSMAGLVLAAVTAESAVSLARQEAPVARNCSSSVYGDLESDWLKSSIVAGPLAFAYAREYSSSRQSFASVGGGRYRPTKLLALVRTLGRAPRGAPRATTEGRAPVLAHELQ